jgi:hypothetical protein
LSAVLETMAADVEARGATMNGELHVPVFMPCLPTGLWMYPAS